MPFFVAVISKLLKGNFEATTKVYFEALTFLAVTNPFFTTVSVFGLSFSTVMLAVVCKPSLAATTNFVPSADAAADAPSGIASATLHVVPNLAKCKPCLYNSPR